MNKRIYNHCIILLLTSLAFSVFGQNNVFNEIEKRKAKNWKQKALVFKKYKKSFFTKENAGDVIIFTARLNMKNKPVIRDCEYNFYKFLKSKEQSQLKIKKGKIEGKSIPGTMLDFSPPANVLFLYNDKWYSNEINSWYLMDDTPSHCRDAYTFPSIEGKQLEDLPKDEWQKAKEFVGIALINEKFTFPKVMGKRIIGKKIKIKRCKRQKVNTIDIDGDKKYDIFWYTEKIDARTDYIRVYQNIDGKWECVWNEIIQECV